jgi:hypothetical protein
MDSIALIRHYRDIKRRLGNSSLPNELCIKITVPAPPKPKDTGRRIYRKPIGPVVCSLVMPPKPKAIIRELCINNGIEPWMLFSEWRKREVAWLRQQIAYRLYYECRWSLSKIGKLFHRDHTTIAYGICRYAEREGLPNAFIHRNHPNIRATRAIGKGPKRKDQYRQADQCSGLRTSNAEDRVCERAEEKRVA